MRRGGRHRTAPARTAMVVLVAGALTLAGGAVAPPGVAAGEPVGTVSSWPVDPVPGIPGASSPRSIAAGPDGNLWFALAGNASGAGIGRITPSGQVTTWAPIPGLAPYGVVDITSGPDGNLWFTTGKPGTVGRAKPDGTIDLLPVKSADGKYDNYFVASHYAKPAGDAPLVECWGAFTLTNCAKTGSPE